jgi:hypothetical protein
MGQDRPPARADGPSARDTEFRQLRVLRRTNRFAMEYLATAVLRRVHREVTANPGFPGLVIDNGGFLVE